MWDKERISGEPRTCGVSASWSNLFAPVLYKDFHPGLVEGGSDRNPDLEVWLLPVSPKTLSSKGRAGNTLWRARSAIEVSRGSHILAGTPSIVSVRSSAGYYGDRSAAADCALGRGSGRLVAPSATTPLHILLRGKVH
eukprot:scaffold3416_cov57-Phaeocystis_antarctica.AAC.1